MRRCLYALLVCCLICSTRSIVVKREQHNSIGHAMRTIFDHPGQTTCPGCSDLKAEISEAELANLRVEFIKRQILKKLKLKEVPKVSSANKLPKPLLGRAHINTMRKHIEDEDMLSDDDFFGRTNQVILFPVQDESECTDSLGRPVACFTYELPKDIHMEDIATADFWSYKHKDFFDEEPDIKQRFAYYTQTITSSLDVPFEQHVTKIQDGWIKLDVAATVRSWLEFNQWRNTIKIVCETCGFQAPWSPVSQNQDQRPFLIINTETNKKKRRPKRNINCMPGVSECCREKLYISFVEIGWSEWVIQPRGYEAYFCRGSCSNAASLTLSGSGYSSVVRRLFQQGGKKLELVPCCTATHLSPLQLIYMDNNQTITQKTLPNMVVDSCGCM